MVHLYSPKVQERCVQLGLATHERIKRNSLIFKVVCVPGYIGYVRVCVYGINGAKGFIFGIQRRYKLMKIIVAIAFYFLYWGVCFLGTGTDKKNLIGLRSYPEEVQNRVRSDHQLGKAVPKGKSTAAVWLSNLLLFTVVFSALGLALRGVLNLDGYLSAFWYFLAFSEGLGLFDLLVIDLLWWRNTKRTRFSFLPEKKYYQNPKKHIESFWRGIPLFAAVAALSALIVTAF